MGFGAYGKIPALGDFLKLDLAAGFIGPWDRWLQTGLTEVKAGLGERWQDCFFSAPIWRFSLAPGVAGETAMMGVLMASVDRVGRQFPLTLAASLGSEALGPRHLAMDPVFASLEDIALAALEDDMTRDGLAARLASIAAPVAPSLGVVKRDSAGVVATAKGSGIAPLLCSEDSRLVDAGSIWTAILPEGPRLMTAPKLPDAMALTALFDLSAPVWPEDGA